MRGCKTGYSSTGDIPCQDTFLRQSQEWPQTPKSAIINLMAKIALSFLLGSAVVLAGIPSGPVLAQTDQPERLSEDEQAVGTRFDVAWFRVRRAFTFQAARKAELDQRRLERLEAKLAQCQEDGNEACIARLESLLQKAEDRAQRHLERKQEVLESHRLRFEEFRNRRQQRREQLIETRSERVKDRLDVTRERVQEHRQNIQDSLE